MLSLGLINLLERLTELREIFYLLDNWLIVKGMRATLAQSALGHHSGSSPNPIARVFIEDSLHRHD